MASPGPEPGVLAAVPQICPHCRKSFPRLCDLNKHAKSHSRPFKCSVPNCKYHHHGWPTAKELERHVNDKHSLAPRTYACAYASCTYESKRESNCKQHMEKKHGWNYIRSKSNGKRLPIQDCAATHPAGPVSNPQVFPSREDITSHEVPASPRSPSAHHFDSDFILYPDHADRNIVLGQADEELGRGYADPEDDESRVFLPWTSPATRMLKNQSMLETFTETYNRALDKSLGHPDAMIDPSLQHFGNNPVAGWQRLESDKLSAITNSVKTEPPNMGIDRFSWNGGSDTGSAPADSPSDRRNPSTAYSSQFHTPHSGAVDFTGPAAHAGQMGWNLSSRRRGSDEESQRPEKKLKSSPVEDFTDNNMPDIFRFAHPRIYDRDQMEKYSPCHSSHRDISTLVRHLGRPAHRLTVTKETISSFDIEDEEYPHPRVGICRRCWRQFSQRHAFDEHASGPCDKVSKGKREKWQILYDSFTPLVAPTAVVVTTQATLEEAGIREEPIRSPTRQSGFFPAGVEGVTWDHASPATSLSSPVTYLRSAGPTSVTDDALIPAHEYERVQRERNELERRNQQLERILAERRVATLGGAPRDLGGSPLSLQMEGPLGSMPLIGRMPLPRPSAADEDASPDRDNLVLHMGSQPEEVDIEGLMNEPQENLSRQNSGLSSSSRSTVHHVTTSPPQRLVEFEEGDETKGNQPESATPNRKPPPSIPDSGYSSAGHHRHGSFGDISHMPGDLQRGHQRNSSSLSSVTYHPRKLPGTGEGIVQGPQISWRPTLYEAPASTPVQSAAQDQQPHHTFLPGQTPAQGEPSIDEFFNMDNIDFLNNMFDR